jgi:hypothetical protein
LVDPATLYSRAPFAHKVPYPLQLTPCPQRHGNSEFLNMLLPVPGALAWPQRAIPARGPKPAWHMARAARAHAIAAQQFSSAWASARVQQVNKLSPWVARSWTERGGSLAFSSCARPEHRAHVRGHRPNAPRHTRSSHTIHSLRAKSAQAMTLRRASARALSIATYVQARRSNGVPPGRQRGPRPGVMR